MIKKLTLPLLLLSPPLSSVRAQELSGFYLSGKVGLSLQQQSDRDLKTSGVDLIAERETYSLLNFGSTTKSILSGGVAGGYNFKPQFNVPVRVELEYIARDNGSQSIYKEHLDFALLVPNHGDNALNYNSRIRTQTMMINGYWDFDIVSSIMSYITVGLGVAHNRLQHQTNYRVISNVNSINMAGNNVNFSWSVGTGIAYRVNDSWSLDLGYRYLDAGKASANTSWRSTAFNIDAMMTAGVNTQVRYHDIHAGIQYNF